MKLEDILAKYQESHLSCLSRKRELLMQFLVEINNNQLDDLISTEESVHQVVDTIFLNNITSNENIKAALRVYFMFVFTRECDLSSTENQEEAIKEETIPPKEKKKKENLSPVEGDKEYMARLGITHHFEQSGDFDE